MEAARQQASHATNATAIEAKEEDEESEIDRDILAAITKADCCASPESADVSAGQ